VEHQPSEQMMEERRTSPAFHISGWRGRAVGCPQRKKGGDGPDLQRVFEEDTGSGTHRRAATEDILLLLPFRRQRQVEGVQPNIVISIVNSRIEDGE